MFFWKKLKANTVPISKITQDQKTAMFELFQKFYEDVDKDQFIKDMNAKDSIIILTSKNKELRGFSTLTSFDVLEDNRLHHIIYSGDTIIDPSYWGTAALTMEFLKNIIKAKMKRPFSPVWWYLISKGYKTYLLMANNFMNYYPRYDRKTPVVVQKIMNDVSEKLYPGRHDQNNGILVFQGERHEKLKDFVAPISQQLKEKYPKIKFFADKNPNWMNGDELVCLGEVNLALSVVHPFKVISKTIKKIGHRRVTSEKPSA